MFYILENVKWILAVVGLVKCWASDKSAQKQEDGRPVSGHTGNNQKLQLHASHVTVFLTSSTEKAWV